MVPLHYVEAQVRKEFGAVQRRGVRYEEEADFSLGREILRFRLSWKSPFLQRRSIGVYFDFTRHTVRTQPRVRHLDLEDRSLPWLSELLAAVPPVAECERASRLREAPVPANTPAMPTVA